MSIVYTGGTFDLFHSGHVNFLRRCRDIAGDQGTVVVGVNSDEFIMRYKKKAPIQTLEERMAVLGACRFVDRVIVNVGEEDAKPVLLTVNPNYVVIGSDWARKDYYAQMKFTQDWLDQKNIGLIYIPYTKGISSTQIRDGMR